MSDIGRILFPTDFSETADEALAQAAEMARFFTAELALLHVVRSLPHDFMAQASSASFEATLDALEKDAEERISALSEMPEISIREMVRRGNAVAPAILDAAAEVGADLIVMGTHGHRGLRKWLAGSVTQEVVREADRPVLTLRRREHGLDFEQAKRFLVPVDFSESSRRTLVYARELAAAAEASLHLLHVVEIPIYPSFYAGAGAPAALAGTGFDLEPLRKRSREQLEGLLEKTPGPDVPTELTVVKGDPADVIVDLAGSESSDLVIMASHGLGGLARLLVGSVTESVMQRANRPVLILRSVEEVEEAAEEEAAE